MKIFESNLTVKQDDLDELNHVNNVRYVQWVQEVAKMHWQNEASSEMIKNYYWVMIKHCIEYKNSAYLNDVVTLKTYIENSKGPISTRIVEIINYESGQLLAKSKTEWCLINVQNQKPMRITPEIEGLF